jgi:hypothetical protein
MPLPAQYIGCCQCGALTVSCADIPFDTNEIRVTFAGGCLDGQTAVTQGLPTSNCDIHTCGGYCRAMGAGGPWAGSAADPHGTLATCGPRTCPFGVQEDFNYSGWLVELLCQTQEDGTDRVFVIVGGGGDPAGEECSYRNGYEDYFCHWTTFPGCDLGRVVSFRADPFRLEMEVTMIVVGDICNPEGTLQDCDDNPWCGSESCNFTQRLVFTAE